MTIKEKQIPNNTVNITVVQYTSLMYLVLDTKKFGVDIFHCTIPMKSFMSIQKCFLRNLI